MGDGELLVTTDGAVRELTLNRPEQRNAFTIELYAALTEALRDADGDLSVGAAVLTGAGPAFCGGTDLGELAEIAAGRAPAGAGDAFPGLLSALTELEVPLVAAVNGPGVGVGFTMLPFCDVVVVADSARFRAPFAEMGVPPEAASSYLLPLRMGWTQASRALLMGEWLSAREAVETGLATECAAADQVLPRARELAGLIARHPPAALRTAKRLMQAARRDAILAARAREETEYARLFGPGQRTEGD